MDSKPEEENFFDEFEQKVAAYEEAPLTTFPDEFSDFLLKLIADVQAKKEGGNPPTIVELRQEFVKNPGDFAAHIPKNQGIFRVFWKTGKTYMDKTGSYISTEKWNDDFYTYQEYFEEKWGKPFGYIIDDRDRVRPGESTKTVEFAELWDILSSTDEQKLKDAEWLYNDVKHAKFLNKASDVTVETTGNAVGYASFPRSGNAFLRKYLSNITGIQTGSDMGMNVGLHAQQMLCDFIGENITDASVWVTKTHDPKFIPHSMPSKVNKMICCVRNPYDVMVSMTHFSTGAHSAVLAEDFAKDIPAIWQEMIRSYVDQIKAYHSHVMLEVNEHVPIHYLRYEDLLTNPKEVLENLFCFLMNRDSIEGLNIQRRIQAAIDMGHKATQAYAQKVDTSNAGKQDESQIGEKKFVFNRSIDLFSIEQQEFISNELKDFFEIFGYACKMKDSESEADRYTVSEEWLTEQQSQFNFAKYDEINTEQLNSFIKLNAQSLAEVCQLASEDKLNSKSYVTNYDPEGMIQMSQEMKEAGMNLLMSTSLKEKPQIKKE